MVVILGKSDYIAFRGYLQSAAATDFDVGTLKLSDEWAITLEDSHVKPVAMAVPYQDITSITDINSIRVVSEVLAANTSQEVTFLIENNHTMSL